MGVFYFFHLALSIPSPSQGHDFGTSHCLGLGGMQIYYGTCTRIDNFESEGRLQLKGSWGSSLAAITMLYHLSEVNFLVCKIVIITIPESGEDSMKVKVWKS